MFHRPRMLRSKPFLRFAAVFAAFVTAAWGLTLWWTFTPDLATRLRDDAFYEFVWANDLAQGGGGSVSAGVTTSGVQWLWSLALATISWLLGPCAVTFAPFLGAALHAAAAAVWWRIPRDPSTGVVLGLCWLGHPLLLREAFNGQETALAAFAATVLFAARRAREPRFSLLCVLATLARSDLFALVLSLSCWRHRDRLRRSLAAPGFSLAAVTALNVAFGGGLLQDSALPMSWLWHANLEAVSGFWFNQWWYTRPVLLGGPFATASVFGCGLMVFLVARPWLPVLSRFAPLLAVAGAAALGVRDLEAAGVAASLLAIYPSRRVTALHLDLLAVGAGLAAIVALHWAVRWYPRDYYLTPVVVIAFAAMCRCGRARWLLLAFPVCQLLDIERVQPEPLAAQAEMQLAGDHLDRVLPAGERVGCFNSGIVTARARAAAAEEGDAPRGILNLDGVVDHRSFAALRAGRLSAWLDEQQVRFLLDGPQQFSLDPAVPHACGRFFGRDFDPRRDLVELARFDVVGVGSDRPSAAGLRLYWRRGRGQRPPSWASPGELREVPRLVDGKGPSLVLWGARAGEALVCARADGRVEQLCVVDVDTTVLLDRVAMGPGDQLRVERR